ncbi:MAG: winged helix-turn-helix transcriptional regulator [Clostridiales bacterium]|nr:winged helix-turn-helix transcriptional regulator [Clostridiales bacterium]
MERNFVEEARIFKAFCDENRLQILELLQNGEYSASEILAGLNISQSTLSHHMKILCESGIVAPRREGKWTYYSINRENREKAIILLESITKVHNKAKW